MKINMIIMTTTMMHSQKNTSMMTMDRKTKRSVSITNSVMIKKDKKKSVVTMVTTNQKKIMALL